MTALTNAITVLEAEIANFVAVDAAVNAAAIDYTMTDAELDAVDRQFGHTAACESVKAAELAVVRCYAATIERKRGNVAATVADCARDWKLRRNIVARAWTEDAK